VLVLLASQYGDADASATRRVAVSLEMIHMASLVHDDVIDNAELRRGKKTVKAKYDNRVAMFTGDYIFARAIDLMTELENAQIHKQLSWGIMEMSLGEIEQIKDLFRLNQKFRTYLRRIKRKTALLMALSCELGALASGASPQISKKLYFFGYFLGMSYQITDDILDFVGTEKQLGKPAGSDLKQGNITLPTLFAIEKDSELKQLIAEKITNEDLSNENWNGIIQKIRVSAAIQSSQKISDLYLRKAYRVLDKLPQNKPTESFRIIADYIGTRKY
jgi:heptaprenyl diphosphate synthase